METASQGLQPLFRSLAEHRALNTLLFGLQKPVSLISMATSHLEN